MQYMPQYYYNRNLVQITAINEMVAVTAEGSNLKGSCSYFLLKVEEKHLDTSS